MNSCNKHPYAVVKFDGPNCPDCARNQVANMEARGAPDATAGVAATLAERGARYGDFTDHARICDALIAIAEGNSPALKALTSWGDMKPFQRQALRVIMNKLARILNGDPDYIDNWHDLCGYAKLVEDRLTK